MLADGAISTLKAFLINFAIKFSISFPIVAENNIFCLTQFLWTSIQMGLLIMKS